jgi:hypothetical protein
MRLLNTQNFQLIEHHSEIPPYAILSHRWVEGEEVSFEDMQAPDRDQNAGFRKIQNCCTQAAIDRYEYVWVDTCCIDKNNNAEVSEAINSMYRWYEKAGICYAYLHDVNDAENPEPQFAKSKWFTRGWTLQELVAPQRVVFFGDNGSWFEIETKITLREAIKRITKIDTRVLECNQYVFKASIAQRMSWASGRETTRPEDMAYCLLGIFKVNMPLLYGEAENAFLRLQLELLNVSNDHTIFAWSRAGDGPAPERPPPLSGLFQGPYGSNLDSDIGGLGLLAPSASEFSDCGDIIQTQENSSSSHYMTNIGLCITLPTTRGVRKGVSTEYCGFLDCYREMPGEVKGGPKRICLSLRYEGNSRFYRVSTVERLLQERHLWARMTPMFITRVRSHRVKRSIHSDARSPAHANCGPRVPPNTNLDGISRIQVTQRVLSALQKSWSSCIDRATPADERTPLLRDLESDPQGQLTSGHHEQPQRFWQRPRKWAQWLVYSPQTISCFLAKDAVKLLLIFIPLGIFAGVIRMDPAAVFVLNFLAIMGLAPLLNFATELLSANVGYHLGGMINAIFGSAVEIIVSSQRISPPI